MTTKTRMTPAKTVVVTGKKRKGRSQIHIMVGVLLTHSSLRCTARPLCSSSRRAARSPLTLQNVVHVDRLGNDEIAHPTLHVMNCVCQRGQLRIDSLVKRCRKVPQRLHVLWQIREAVPTAPCVDMCSAVRLVDDVAHVARQPRSELITVCPSFGEHSNMARIVVHGHVC